MDVLDPEPASWDWIEERLDGKRKRPGGLFMYLSVAAAAALLVLAFFLNPGGSGEVIESALPALAVGDAFPELTLDNQYGVPVPLSSLQGNVVLVEFWASYSKICTDRQCYYFQPIYEQYAEKGFEIYGISLDTNSREWLSLLENEGLPWVNVAETDDIAALRHKFLVQELPTTYLLDQYGNIIAKDIGTDELEVHLERLLAED